MNEASINDLHNFSGHLSLIFPSPLSLPFFLSILHMKKYKGKLN